MNPREIAIHAATVEQLKAEHSETRGVAIGSGYVTPPLSDEERRKREEASRAASLATINDELPPQVQDRRRLEQRMQAEQIEQLKAEIAGNTKTRTFGHG